MFELLACYLNAENLLATLFGLAIQFVVSLTPNCSSNVVVALCAVDRMEFWVETNYGRHVV
jgi:hypothetical protein